MKRFHWSERIARSAGSSLLGALYGGLFAALCSSIADSALASGVIVCVAALLGSWAGRFLGLILGAIYGVLFVTLGNAIGGSTLGVVLTILSCALLGGWLQWVHDRWLERRARRQEDLRLSTSATTTVNANNLKRENRCEKELVLCN